MASANCCINLQGNDIQKSLCVLICIFIPNFSVTAYEPIENHIDYFVRSSKKPDILPQFTGQGTIPFYLLSDSEVFLDIQLSEQTLISGLKFSMQDDKAIELFSLSVREWGIQFPNDYTYWGLHKLHFGDMPTDSSPVIKVKMVMKFLCTKWKLVTFG